MNDNHIVPPAWHTHLRDELQNARIEKDPADLIKCLDNAIATYNAYRKNDSISSNSPDAGNLQPPKSLKDELAIAADKAADFMRFIQELSCDARAIVASPKFDEEGQAIPRSDMLSNLEYLDHVISFAQSAITVERGRPVDERRLQLAVDVAACIQHRLSIRPKKTKNGPYEAVLAVMLRAVTGEDPNDVHDLAMRAIDQYRSQVE